MKPVWTTAIELPPGTVREAGPTLLVYWVLVSTGFPLGPNMRCRSGLLFSWPVAAFGLKFTEPFWEPKLLLTL